MKKINHSKPLHRRVKRFTIIAGLLAILSPFTPALALDPAQPFTIDLSPVVKAINDAKDAIILETKQPRDDLKVLFLKALDDTFLTTNASVVNMALLKPEGNYSFTESKENKGPATSPYELVRQASQHSAALKLQSALSNKDPEAQRQVLSSASDAKDAIAKMLDAQNFLGPLAYTSDEQNEAELTVAFLSDYASPFGTIDLEKLNTNEENKDTEVAKAYRIKVYTNAAIRSLLLGNLYDSFNARIPVVDLAEKSGMPKKGSASLAEVEKYAATRRIADPKWYETINNTPSIGVERETVFILAEIQAQLYQLHRDNERMLQTMTAIGVTNLRAAGGFPDANEIDLKQKVDGTKMVEKPLTDESFSSSDGLNRTSPPKQKEGAIPSVPR